jgi:hypothetical protein
MFRMDDAAERIIHVNGINYANVFHLKESGEKNNS